MFELRDGGLPIKNMFEKSIEFLGLILSRKDHFILFFCFDHTHNIVPHFCNNAKALRRYTEGEISVHFQQV